MSRKFKFYYNLIRIIGTLHEDVVSVGNIYVVYSGIKISLQFVATGERRDTCMGWYCGQVVKEDI